MKIKNLLLAAMLLAAPAQAGNKILFYHYDAEEAADIVVVMNEFPRAPEMVTEAGPDFPMWIGNSFTWPDQGSLAPDQDLWINTETWPITDSQKVMVHYRINDGAWQHRNLLWKRNKGTHSLWQVKLGRFSAGQEVEYYLSVQKDNKRVKDNAGGANYRIRTSVRNPVALKWIGNTKHLIAPKPVNGMDQLQVNVDTHPHGAAQSVRLAYSINHGEWKKSRMLHRGEKDGTDLWTFAFDRYVKGTHIRYAIEAIDGYGYQRWENNDGLNHEVVFN